MIESICLVWIGSSDESVPACSGHCNVGMLSVASAQRITASSEEGEHDRDAFVSSSGGSSLIVDPIGLLLLQ